MSKLAVPIEQELVITRNESMRHSILDLESLMKEGIVRQWFPEADLPLHHQFAPGAYARTIFIPQGTLVVGKIHKHPHLNMLVCGTVSLATEEGPLFLEALKIMTSKAGTKRVVYAHTDTVWTTIHLTDKTDLAEIEEDIIAKTYEEFDALQDPAVQQLLPLLQQKEAL